MAKAPRTSNSAATAIDTIAAQAPAVDKETNGPTAAATGTTLFTDTREQSDQGGAGNGAGSAGSVLHEDLDKSIGDAELYFRTTFPCLALAFDGWRAVSSHEPTGVRIVAKVEGFRRSGMAHSVAPVEHLFEVFSRREGQRVDLDLLEALFAEPNLVVELI